MELTLSVRKKYDYAIINAIGNISYYDAKKIEDYIKNEVPKKSKSIILNTKKTPFISTSAFPLFAEIEQQLRKERRHFFIMSLNDELIDLVKNKGFSKYFTLIKDEESLVKTLAINE